MINVRVKTAPEIFDSYVADFRKITGKSARFITIGFKKINDKFSGICYYAINNIAINKNHWNRMDKYKKKSVVYHELGHCVCWEGHDYRFLRDGCPRSLMYYATISSWCLRHHWNHYLSDLREKCDT